MTLAVADLSLEERERFAVLRRRAGLKQSEIAQRAGTYRLLVSRWEAGSLEPADEIRAELWSALEQVLASAA
jgi:transcriptional regulator with XRE-family HTH domain